MTSLATTLTWISKSWRSRRVGTVVVVLLALVAIEVVYWGLLTAGHWDRFRPQMLFHDMQAEGFRQGRLSLLLEPRPELLRVTDPYDVANARFWVMDLTYYEGRYYLYWGPVPALLLAAGKELLGWAKPVGDSFLTFCFFSLHAAAGAVLITRALGRFFPRHPRYVLVLSVLAFAFANPTPHGVASGSVYVASISAAQAFLWWGIVFGVESVAARSARRRSGMAWCAGVAFAIALGCRISLAPALALLGLLFALSSGGMEKHIAWYAKRLAPFAVPLAAGAAGLLWYNQARFDRFLEFGTTLQLSAYKFRTSTDYLLANLHSYWLRAYDVACDFPYFIQGRGVAQERPWAWLGVPDDYLTVSPMVGILYGLPLIFGVGFLAVAGWGAWRSRQPGWVLRLRDEGEVRFRTLVATLLALVVASSVTGLLELGLYVATMRYLSDVSSGLSLLGLFGTWVCLAAAVRPATSKLDALRRGTLRVLGLGLPIVSIGLGLLLGYQGYNHHFKTTNPELDASLRAALSFCSPHR